MSPEDLRAMREVLHGYQVHRLATGKPLSRFWVEKVVAGLRERGIWVRIRGDAPDNAPRKETTS